MEHVWRALSSPHRRQILELLREGPRTTGSIAKSVPELSRFAVMQHLSVLEEAKLVLARKDGRTRLNYVNPVPIREVVGKWVTDRSMAAAETALRLRRYAETEQEAYPYMQSQSSGIEFRCVQMELEIPIRAPRERVFAALTEEIDRWWPHRYKPDSTVVYDGGSCGEIREVFSNGGGAVYGRVVYCDPPHKLASTGPSSLNKGFNAYSVETLEETADGTLYKKSMTLWGHVPVEHEQMFREGMRAILEQAICGYLERGETYNKGAQS